MIIVLVVVDLIIVGIVVGQARDHDLTIKRIHTVDSFYATEAGINMAFRELTYQRDEDGDGTIGTPSPTTRTTPTTRHSAPRSSS